jgi:GNAT superfamily N-acetyltransferase
MAKVTGPAAFRRAGPADAGAVLALTRAAYAKWVKLIGREPLPMRADPALAIAAHRVDLLEAGGLLLGVVETHLHADHLWVENLCVAPDHQGQGIGGRLLARAEALARAAGRRRIALLTNPAFTGNVAFYLRHDFEVTRVEPFLGGHATWFQKVL